MRLGEAWWALLCFFAVCSATAHAGILLSTPSAAGELPIRTWKQQRDASIVKQEFDYSCGAASLATVLQFFYGAKIGEEDLLTAMGKEEAASFADMARVLPHFGFKAVGVAMSVEQLSQLKIPVLLHLRFRGQEHFSVLRGIGNGAVWLADPSWGNRRLAIGRFREMWESEENGRAQGKALLILPQSHRQPLPGFFGRPGDLFLPRELLPLRTF